MGRRILSGLLVAAWLAVGSGVAWAQPSAGEGATIGLESSGARLGDVEHLDFPAASYTPTRTGVRGTINLSSTVTQLGTLIGDASTEINGSSSDPAGACAPGMVHINRSTGLTGHEATAARAFVCCDTDTWCRVGNMYSADEPTSVGPSCGAGACWTAGVATTGSTLIDWEGVTADGTNLFRLAIADNDPSAFILWSIPDASAWLLFPSGVQNIVGDISTNTLTGKTINAESSGNVITNPSKLWIPAAGCNNATAYANLDLPTSNAPTPACQTGSNTTKGVLGFDQTTEQSGQATLFLPSDWTGAIDATFMWISATGSTNAVNWCAQLICTADGETEAPGTDVTFPAQASGNCVNDAGKGTANQVNTASKTGLTATGCAASELLHVRLSRDPDDSSGSTDNHAATANLIGVELTLRRAM